MIPKLLQDLLAVQFGLTVGHDARRHQVSNGRRVTKSKLAGVDAAAIGAGQDFSDGDAVNSKGFSDLLGLLHATGGKVYFLGAVAGRKAPYPFSYLDMRMAQQNNLAALLQRCPDLLLVCKGLSCRHCQRKHQTEEESANLADRGCTHESWPLWI